MTDVICDYDFCKHYENGRITKDETKQYDDWDWECPCSEFGG